jgi:glycosyltransferase involved in cell wall biosynthesis
MTRRILAGFRTAARIVCDSEATRAAVVGHGLVPEDRLRVAPLGLHPAFLQDGDGAAARTIERRLGAKQRRAEILHVGSTIPRKRVDVLLEVFHGVRKGMPGARLLRVGGAFTPAQHDQLVRLGLEDDVTVLPTLEWGEVAAVYRRADAVLLTSEHEGFGLPVLEGLACGAAVIASDIPALRETGGTVATYCPVGDVKSWVAAVLGHLGARERGDAALPFQRAERVEHARKFTWSNHARTMVDLYREMLAENGG